MDPIANAIEKLKSFGKLSEEFFKRAMSRVTNRSRRNPIEIMKRLQRETFTDLMKLRDRQDKVEQLLSFYKLTYKNPFQGANTTLKGEVDVVGSLLYVDNIDQQICDILKKAGVRTGVMSKFTFETSVRENDAVAAEFVARHNNQGYHGDVFGSPLALKKVKYLACINDWVSAIVIPIGAQYRDVAIGLSPLQNRGLTDFSSTAPPLFDEYHGCGAGLMMRGTNITASVAEFVSWLGAQQNSVNVKRCLSTYGQVTFQPIEGTKMTLLGLHQMPNLPTPDVRLDSFTIPFSSLKFNESSRSSMGPSVLPISRSSVGTAPAKAIAMMLETSFDEDTQISGWVEMQRSNAMDIKWAVSLSGTPEDELGWGFSVGGLMQRPSTLIHFQFETFLNLHFGKKFRLQPSLVYATNNRSGVPALMLRSSWSL